MAHPVDVLRSTKACLGDCGVLLIADERVGYEFGTESERVFYAWSVLACLSNTIPEDGTSASGACIEAIDDERDGILCRVQVVLGGRSELYIVEVLCSAVGINLHILSILHFLRCYRAREKNSISLVALNILLNHRHFFDLDLAWAVRNEIMHLFQCPKRTKLLLTRRSSTNQ